MSLSLQVTVMFFAVLFMCDFIIRNGLRGFLFADLLEFPLILLGTFIILAGALILGAEQPTFTGRLFISSPHFPIWWGLLFCVATLFLISFLLITSEAHWLRVWTIRDQVSAATVKSASTTAAMWLILVFVGFVIIVLSTQGGTTSCYRCSKSAWSSVRCIDSWVLDGGRSSHVFYD
jgi:hypothetical protein